MSEEKHCCHADGGHEEKRHHHEDGGHDEGSGLLDSLFGGSSSSVSSMQKLFASGGTEFWLGAAVGAAAIAIAFNPKVRDAVGGLFSKQASTVEGESTDEDAEADDSLSLKARKAVGTAKTAKAKKIPTPRSRAV